MTTPVLFSIGSNCCWNVSFIHTIVCMRKILQNIKCSHVWLSKPLHGHGPMFRNACIYGETLLSISELFNFCKETESACGYGTYADFNGQKIRLRCLDIDVLVFGNLKSDIPEIPRHDIWTYDFAVIPADDIVPDLLIPGKVTVHQIAADFSEHKLIRVDDIDLWGGYASR